jgi:hypothetical protein
VIIMSKPVPVPPASHPGSSADDQPVADLSSAPLPTTQTLRRRRNLAYQAVRFVAFNSRIMRMVLRGHKSSR